MGSPEELVNGADHVHKTGSLVCVDVTCENGQRVLHTGVFGGARDEFENDTLVRTVLFVGHRHVLLDWDHDPSLEVLITVESGPQE